MVAICVECWDEYPVARKKLGYNTCLECGEANARVEIARKAKCTAPAYNKGAYQYVGTVQAAKGVGR
jgi:ferredoxin-like protein FixX|tara:strand:- start:2766 stop:2966 length:201 start_codon:yes stop_codon:yes gene_type:complete